MNPLVKVECGDRSVEIPPPTVGRDKKNLNFPQKVLSFDVVSGQ